MSEPRSKPLPSLADLEEVITAAMCESSSTGMGLVGPAHAGQIAKRVREFLKTRCNPDDSARYEMGR